MPAEYGPIFGQDALEQDKPDASANAFDPVAPNALEIQFTAKPIDPSAPTGGPVVPTA